MLFKSITAAAILAATVSGAAVVKRDDPDWTIRDASRDCAADDSSCTWQFTIDNNLGDSTYCRFVTTPRDGQGAARSNGGPADCGVYKGIQSGWSGQFGDDKGFTTFGANNYDRGVIGFFSFTDAEVANGQHVGARQAHVQRI